MKNHKIINDNCWVACFDILGFENILRYVKEQTASTNLDVVARCYHENIIKDLKRSCKEQKNVEIYHFCLSDSFLFFSPDDSPNSFLGMKYAAELFLLKLIGWDIPFRGSLSIGDFYADRKENIFIGQGFIDAYRYAEKQNWIGFVLTPEACKKLGERKKCLKDYKEYAVPIKEKRIKDGIKQIVKTSENLFAFHFHRLFPPNEGIGIEQVIKQMLKKAQDRYKPCDVEKYENTFKFFEETK